MTVRVVTDSVADLPAEVARELGITVVPLSLRFGTSVYRDGIDISAEEFYRRLSESKTLPVTSVPAPAAFSDTYDRLAEQADEILVITVSARLSATHDVAVQSIELMKRKARVKVIDSTWAVMAQGFIVMAAARAAKAGASLDETLKEAERQIARVDFRGAFDSLQYLEKGGRIGKAQALAGSLLRVNPIIGLKNGEVFPMGRERSRNKAMDNLYNFAVNYGSVEALAVEYATGQDDAEQLADRLHARFPEVPIYRSRTSPAIGTHTGPSLLVVSVVGEKQKTQS